MSLLSKIGFATVIVGIGWLCTDATQQTETPPLSVNEKMQEKLVNDYNVYALPLPESLDFAGEPVPLDDPDVRERMDRELLVNTYWQSNGLLIIKRAHKYFPIIEPLLKEYGIPDDFKYLAIAESGLENNSSPAGAAGFWHFLKGTGREYGLEINDYVDERYNLELATKVAAQYLKASKKKFGSWTMAAAAYNAGNGGMSNQIGRQKEDNYYDLLLNSETSRYVFRILAFKEILTHPQKYGFNFREQDLYTAIPSRKVMVDTVVTDFADFAHHFGISYKVLKLHNPWLRETYLKNASGKQYFIEIPEKGYYKNQ
ncbi:MAG TPA: lytic transglycosylase domain-containing protein [Flavobacteriaceae bacterium]|nr:lytic transglycosylase domain-containing protein [Flavobacteriaceae bacterium]HPF11292.1 lytic transglycosylase domain-containing protein [Flavobacteriaceae bacterium]HQU22216.1 lytic transglycosylase domain-containing protein [Flavobacteriaceae bacterium]HQU64489.1 lytic transglycosylase domain-containing protein [Flavobacteriaceae bacterium]HRW44620.1 lytic transglycosylase domain-containing protein [Flavobacteriaceae bacterium]